jgi:hypothetical protein
MSVLNSGIHKLYFPVYSTEVRHGSITMLLSNKNLDSGTTTTMSGVDEYITPLTKMKSLEIQF